MATAQERRRIRLQNDYKEMQNIKGSIIQWQPLSGTAPYIEAYEITIHVRTIISSRPDYRDTHVLHVTLPPGYPESAPQIVMQTSPQPYHPNWYSDKRWCYGSWDISEGLGHHVVRMIQTLQFDMEITNPDSSANSNATSWYNANLRRGLFPCDKQILPDPTGIPNKRFDIHTKKTFRIE